jgi:hypothetical protein
MKELFYLGGDLIMDKNKVIELRKSYTQELYSPDLTKELLVKLYEFINSPLVEEKEWFSDYDKACLLSAYEIIDKLQENNMK